MNKRSNRHKAQLQVEALEDRTVPAVLTVNSLLDNVIAGDGLVTLREALVAANTDGATDLGETGSGADEIALAAGLNGTINLQLGELVVTDSVTITGLGAESTIVDAQQQSRTASV